MAQIGTAAQSGLPSVSLSKFDEVAQGWRHAECSLHGFGDRHLGCQCGKGRMATGLEGPPLAGLGSGSWRPRAPSARAAPVMHCRRVARDVWLAVFGALCPRVRVGVGSSSQDLVLAIGDSYAHGSASLMYELDRGCVMTRRFCACSVGAKVLAF